MRTAEPRIRETTPNKHYAPVMHRIGTITLRWVRDTAYTTKGEVTVEPLYAERIHGSRVIGWGEGMLPLLVATTRDFAEVVQIDEEK